MDHNMGKEASYVATDPLGIKGESVTDLGEIITLHKKKMNIFGGVYPE